MEHHYRNREGGGICPCFRRDIAYNRSEDLSVSELEFLGVDLLLTKTKSILAGVAHRPPKDNSFYNKLENMLTNSPIFILRKHTFWEI